MLARTLTPTPFSMGYFYSPVLKSRIVATLERERFDLIFVHCSSVAQFVSHVDRDSRTLYATLHGPADSPGDRRGWHRSIGRSGAPRGGPIALADNYRWLKQGEGAGLHGIRWRLWASISALASDARSLERGDWVQWPDNGTHVHSARAEATRGERTRGWCRLMVRALAPV